MRRGSLKRKIFGPQVCQLKTVSTEGFTPVLCAYSVPNFRLSHFLIIKGQIDFYATSPILKD